MTIFLVKVGIIIVILGLIISALLAIPEFAALATSATGSTDAAINALEALQALLEQYVKPWIGLLNHVFSPSTKVILVSLVIWLIVKPFALQMLKMGYHLYASLISKL